MALSCGGESLIHSFSHVLLLKAVPTSQREPSHQQSGHGGIPGKSAQQLKQTLLRLEQGCLHHSAHDLVFLIV